MKKSHSNYSRRKKAVIAITFIYGFLLCFMTKMAGIGATVSIFLFLGICSLPALLGRALGDKSRVAGDDDPGGYRYVYSADNGKIDGCCLTAAEECWPTRNVLVILEQYQDEVDSMFAGLVNWSVDSFVGQIAAFSGRDRNY